MSKNSKELRSYQFFEEKTASDLAGIFKEDLWSTFVLQVAQSESSIRYAVSALASFHEHFKQHDSLETTNNAFALKQYNLAIKDVIGTARNSNSLVVHVLSCLIFVSIEVVQGNFESAVRLFKQGRDIFAQLKDDPLQKVCLQKEIAMLHAVMRRIEIQVDQLLGDVIPRLAVDREDLINIPPPITRLETLHEAREYIEEIIYTTMQLISLPEPSIGLLRGRFEMWKKAMDELETRVDAKDPQQRRALALLKMHRLQTQLLADKIEDWSGHTNGETHWDCRLAQFQEMVDLASIAVEASGKPLPSFSFDFGVIGAMLATAVRCRDPVTRRRAIAVMRQSNRQESVWNSKLTASVAERFVYSEEAGIADVQSTGDIPETARLSQIMVFFGSQPKSAVVSFMGRHSDHPIYETLAWG